MPHSPKNQLENLEHNLEFLAREQRLNFPAAEAWLKQQSELMVNDLLEISARSGYPLATLLERRLEPLGKKVKMLVMDCDGVLTDGRMTFTKNGDEIKSFNAKDGQGIKRAQKKGLLTGIISAGRSTGLVEARAEMLGIKMVYVGSEPKMEILQTWLKELKLEMDEIAYIGDDTSDLEILQQAGLAVCPFDAVQAVRESVHLVLQNKGGEGCVRELIDNYLVQASPA